MFMMILSQVSEIGEIFLDSLLDSLKVLAIAFVMYFLLSFVEDKISDVLGKKNHFSPLVGASLGIIPQCGVSVVAANLYLAHHITMGTLIALFISCSDEAVPILFSSTDVDQLLSIVYILGIKFILGFVVGFIVDFCLYKKKKAVEEHVHDDCDHDFENVEIEGCCHHHMGNGSHDKKLMRHFVHPLLHSIKIFLYCLLINVIFGYIIYLVGEENIAVFLSKFKYFSPIISTLVGMIPNCASSVLITETYLAHGIGLGATIAGLSINAGLGLVFLFKRRENVKESFTILGILLLTSIFAGYILSIFFGF